jgi:hypothetical protein
VIDIQRRIRIELHQPFLPPVLQEFCRAGVFVRILSVPRLLAVQLQADEIRGMLFVERLLKLAGNHVVRRRHDVAKRADLAQVVTQTAKSLNRWHGK